jgi:hypothetical protein
MGQCAADLEHRDSEHRHWKDVRRGVYAMKAISHSRCLVWQAAFHKPTRTVFVEFLRITLAHSRKRAHGKLD